MENTFGTRLKELRKKKGLTQQQLAEKLNIHERTVSKWERNVCEPDFCMYGLIARIFGVSIEELWGLSVPSEIVDGNFDLAKFGAAISYERKSAQESQENLASALNVSANTVSKWERGIVCPNKDTFIKLADHFKKKPSVLYFADIPTISASPSVIFSVKKRKRISAALIISLAVVLIAVSVLLICLLPSNNSTEFQPDGNPSGSVCEHNYEKVIMPPTCSMQGYTQYNCVKCGDNFKTDYTSKIAHAYNLEIIPPTCAQQGYTLHKCSKCGDNFKTDYTSKIAHAYNLEIVPPTCAQQGYTLHKCSKCGDSFNTDYTPKIDHNPGGWIIEREPTCAVNGIKYQECSECHNSLQTVTLAKTEHEYFKAGIVLADFGGEEYTVYECKNCGQSYNDNFVSPTNKGLKYKFNFIDKWCEVSGYKEDLGPKVEIPASVNACTVVSVMDRAFTNCASLEEITIPDTVISIGCECFKNCANLKNVILPNKLEIINDETFAGCRSLTNIELPPTVTHIQNMVFLDCENLQTINIPNKVYTIGCECFKNCRLLKNLVLPDSLAEICSYAFFNCSQIKNLIIPSNVFMLGEYAFSGCAALKEVFFVKCNGWFTDEYIIKSVGLNDPETAAEYLTKLYCDKMWERSDSL